MATTLRSFFGFLFQTGAVQTDLAASVPTVANWRLSTVPKYLAPKDVERTLATCDRRTGTGRRDYAMFLLITRVALPAAQSPARLLGVSGQAWRSAPFALIPERPG